MSVFANGYESELNRITRNLREPVDETGFLANVSASFEQFANEEMSISRIKAMTPIVESNFDEYQKITGKPAPVEAYSIRNISASDVEWYEKAARGDERALKLMERTEWKSGWQAWQFWADAAQQYPDKIKSYNDMLTTVSNQLAESREKNTEILKRADGYGKVGQFVGTMGGAMADPVNVATLGFGASISMAKGLGNAYKLLELSAKGFAIGSATEALIQPSVYKFKQELGVKYTASDAIENILAAGVGGALLEPLPQAVRMSYKGFKKNIDKAHFRLASAINKDYAIGLEAKAAMKAMDALKHAVDTNPFKELDPSINGVRTHLTALDKAVMDFRNGEVANVSAITRAIDEKQFPAFSALEAAKATLRKELDSAPTNAMQLRRDIAGLQAEKQKLSESGAVDSLKQELVAQGMPARRAKQQAKQTIEQRRAEIDDQLSAMQAEEITATKALQSSRLLTKIKAAEGAGKTPAEIMEIVKRNRSDLSIEQPVRAPRQRKIEAQEPEPQIRERAEEAQPQQQEQPKAERYQAYKPETKTPEPKQKANQTLYSDIDDIDLINSKALADVEARLADEDFMIPDEAGNLVSARQVLDEAMRGVESAEQLKACFIGAL